MERLIDFEIISQAKMQNWVILDSFARLANAARVNPNLSERQALEIIKDSFAAITREAKERIDEK